MFSYCVNSPVYCSDSEGTRCVIAGTQLNEGARKQYYQTADEAATAFFNEVYVKSMYIRHEVGAEIYATKKNGTTMYSYSSPRVGEPHMVNVYRSVSKGVQYVAYAHTHPNSDNFSSADIRIANFYLGNAYVAGPSGTIKKKYWLKKGIEEIGTVQSMPLIDYQRKQIRDAYSNSWESHIASGCDFGCTEKIWPNQ